MVGWGRGVDGGSLVGVFHIDSVLALKVVAMDMLNCEFPSNYHRESFNFLV